MQGTRFTVGVHLHGTLGANATGVIQLPCPASLVEVSASASNASDATLMLGTVADTDGYTAAFAIGQSNVPVVKNPAAFTGALVTAGYGALHLADNTVILWTLDYDGNGGTAAQHVDILFTFTEG